MDTNQIITDIKKPFFNKYSALPAKWLIEEEIIAEKVLNNYPLYKCIILLGTCSDALEKLCGRNPLFSDNPDIEKYLLNKGSIVYDWRHLLDIAVNQKWDWLNVKDDNKPELMLILGYILIYYLLTIKIYKFLKGHEHNLDTLYIRFSNILQNDKDPFIANFPKKSLDRIVKYIKNTRKKNDKYSDDIGSYLWEVIKNRLPADLQESIDKCIKGETNIDFIPNAVADKLKTESTRNYLDDYLPLSSEETFEESLKDDKVISPDIKSHLKNLENDINKLLSPDNKQLTPRQKDVVRLVLLEDYDKVKAAKELKIDESVVRKDHLPAALKKLRKILAFYNR